MIAHHRLFIKSLLIGVFFFCFSSIGYAQVKPIYFYKDIIVADSTKATHYAICGKLTDQDIWVLKLYNLYNELLFTGSYKDANLATKHGDFVYYNDVERFNEQYNMAFNAKSKPRYKSKAGRFEEGLEEGVWNWYYPNGNIMTTVTLNKGLKEGPYVEYDKNGNALQMGNYVMDKKDGEWFYDKGQKKQVYKMGVLQVAEKTNKKKKNATGSVN